MLLPLLLNNLLDTPAAIPPVFSGTIPGISETLNTGTHQYDFSGYFTGEDTYAIAPAVEAGWSFDTNTGILEIDTDALGVFGTYVVTATNVNGSTDSNAFSVTITEPAEQTATGGWLFRNYYEADLQRRKAARARRKLLEEESEEIPTQLDRQIAIELRKQEAEDDRRQELARLKTLASRLSAEAARTEYGQRVEKALDRAIMKGTFSALEALDRELQRASEEEEFLLQAVAMLLLEDD